MSKEKLVFCGSPAAQEVSAIRVAEDGTQQTGIVRSVEEGKPIHGDEIMILSNTGHPLVYNVDDKISLDSKGPAKVSSPVYRENYDRIFGSLENLPN